MSYIPATIRQLVIQRANGCCEYCLLHRQDHILPFEIDHIIAEKHKGPTHPDNLCFSCFDCNKAKGSDISSVDWEETGKTIPLFHPRLQNWNDHFRLNGVVIDPLTPEGRVTVSLLDLNSPDRIDSRRVLIRLGSYPCHPDTE